MRDCNPAPVDVWVVRGVDDSNQRVWERVQMDEEGGTSWSYYTVIETLYPQGSKELPQDVDDLLFGQDADDYFLVEFDLLTS